MMTLRTAVPVHFVERTLALEGLACVFKNEACALQNPPGDLPVVMHQRFDPAGINLGHFLHHLA